MSAVWIAIGLVLFLTLFSGGNKSGRQSGSSGGPVRIDRPHVIDPEDYECFVCHRRFRKDVMVCPHCGTRFAGHVKDEGEFMFEEDELEAWEEEGL